MITDIQNYKTDILKVKTQSKFDHFALQAFLYQEKHNPVYRDYCNHLRIDPTKIQRIEQIPFLPIEFFKTHKVLCEGKQVKTIFESSGTTGTIRSQHFISDLNHYKRCFLDTFNKSYCNPEELVILGLLPSYLERTGSSLVFMVKDLIKLSNNSRSGFYLDEFDELASTIETLEKEKQKYLLIGVSFALLDFASHASIEIKLGKVIETGGMKGRRKELTKTELHNTLKEAFKLESIHSEYGMTELLSQAYSKADGIFEMPAQMRILIRDAYDPLTVSNSGTGAINIIDLANIDSCCFIATSDLGKVYNNNTFSINGRFDNAEIRGCNLLVY